LREFAFSRGLIGYEVEKPLRYGKEVVE